MLSVLDLCGDESSRIRVGPLHVESDVIARDLEALSAPVGKLQKRNNARRPIPGNGRGRDFTRRFVEQLPHFEKINFMFFCNGVGDVGRISKLCGEWAVRGIGNAAFRNTGLSESSAVGVGAHLGENGIRKIHTTTEIC